MIMANIFLEMRKFIVFYFSNFVCPTFYRSSIYKTQLFNLSGNTKRLIIFIFKKKIRGGLTMQKPWLIVILYVKFSLVNCYKYCMNIQCTFNRLKRN